MSRGVTLLLFTLCLCSFASASVIEELDLQKLADTSDIIAIARVVNSQTVLENGQPWTIATAVLENQLKGERQSSVQIRIPGGYQKIGNRTLVTQIDGVPLPNINERAVVFLSGKDKSRLAFNGLRQGYWKIDVDLEGKEIAGKADALQGSGADLNRLVREVQRRVRERKHP